MNTEYPTVRKRSVRDACRSLQRGLEQAGRRVSVQRLMSWTRGERGQAETWLWHRACGQNLAPPPIVAALPEVAP